MNIADMIPAAYRKVIYTALGVALAVEGVLDLVPDGIEAQLVALLGALGFAMAFSKTSDAEVDEA